MSREQGFMEFSLFKKIIDQVRGKVEHVELYLFGEPLLHPQIFEMIRYARKAKIQTAISTNGTVFNQDKCIKLLKSELDLLTFSIDGVTRETYERIRHHSSFDKVIENITRFLRYKQNYPKPKTIVQLIYMDQNRKERDKFVQAWRRYPDVIIRVKPFKRWKGDIDSINKLSTIGKAIPHAPCIRLWRRLIVQWDGTVVPCYCMYDNDLSMGNLNNKSILEVWNGKKLVQFRERHVKDRMGIEACQRCDGGNFSFWQYIPLILLDNLSIQCINARYEKIQLLLRK